MNVKFDIHAIGNAKGEGGEQKFVKPILRDAMTRKQLVEAISHSSTLTESDLLAAFSAVSHYMAEELGNGHRFYLPGVGYFSLQAGLTKMKDWSKVKGNHVYVNGLSFRPESELLAKVRSKVTFERLEGTTCSQQYTEEEMVKKVMEYLSEHKIINRKIMEIEFHLRCNTARKWLAELVELGVLEKDGARSAPVYYLKK
jgi:predicted histone-like DNA-binding protein